MDLRELPEDAMEARHPWEVTRARFFGRLVEGLQPARVLDVGAGDGYLARAVAARLSAACEVVCYDPLYTAVHLREPERGTGARLRYTREPPSERFDVALLLDVVEHVADDRGFLRETVARNVRPGGGVILSVPAWMQLYTRHDVELGHYRRYRPSELRALLLGCGLELVRAGALFHSLLLPRAVSKLAERARGIRSRPPAGPLAPRARTGASTWRAGELVTSAVQGALALDSWVSRTTARARLPVPGLSVWALARLPGESAARERT